MWPRNLDEKISINVGDMCVDKEQWSQIIREFTIQGGFSLKKIRNDRTRRIARCGDENCVYMLPTSRLGDRVTWQVKSIKENHNCPRLDVNKMASHRWITSRLITYYKANSGIELHSTQKLLMERYGLSIQLHTSYRARKLVKEWIG